MAPKQTPHRDLLAGRLLYVGIAPQHVANRTSAQNLCERVRHHYRGSAASSTPRLPLGCLRVICAAWKALSV
ncbi:GIY-YIG nuclease family protein [Streptomyces sp. BE308]|uniref:GIY-YIG nuclease family protein n=1 Tax=Streptomyces sp. BE308 TaxID=3002529 RepID=UPI002E76883D|nr:hypothetical protein [Streptomyces sp. BE308]